MTQYVLLLRGINVGGNQKVPMAQLKAMLAKLDFEQITTLLNSGNAIFSAKEKDPEQLQSKLQDSLRKEFGFEFSALVIKASMISKLINGQPFQQEAITMSTRLYISFLNGVPPNPPALPYTNQNAGQRIISQTEKTIHSVVDISIVQSTEAMANLQKMYGKQITTRNWNTIEKIGGKL